MRDVSGIESLASGDGRHHLSRTLAPALLISMGYIDLGKWVATVDAGARFGYDLVLLVLFFSLSAILCQYLSICIGVVTGRNLAEICQKEYSRSICGVLGLQAGLSLLVAEVTMIAGIAAGFNLVFEYDDLMTSLCWATLVVNILPYTISYVGQRMAGTLTACIAGFALLLFVVGLLVSQPKIPVEMNAMFPKLSGESAYSLMALLGSNIISHNFYVHSYVVQGQRRSSAPTLGALFHDHFFSMLFVFTGVFLVNDILMGSAAVESSHTMVLTLQDAVELMNQIFLNPAAPVVFLVILIFSSHVISLISIIGSNVILKNFFGVNLPLPLHHVLLKALAMIPTLYHAKVAGSEGIYQLLIICPVIQAMLLPSSVIPVFRVASSRFIMGRYRISLYIEILAFLAFLLMLFTNIIFAAEILFGDSAWTNNLKGNTECAVVLPHSIIVLISCATIAFTLFLAVTPLNSESNEAEGHELSLHSQREAQDPTNQRDKASQASVAHEEVQSPSGYAVPRGSLQSHQKSGLEHNDWSDITVESDNDTQQSTAHTATIPEPHPSLAMEHEESKSVPVVDWKNPIPKVSTATVVAQNTAENIRMKRTVAKDVEVEADVSTNNDKEASHNGEFNKSAGGKEPSSSSDSTPSREGISGSGGGCLSRLPGLGRAARRQLAAILDEFWGHIFDYHGMLTRQANAKGFSFLLGLDLRTAGADVRTDNQPIEAAKSPLMRDIMRGSTAALDARVSYDKEGISPDINFGLQLGAIGSSTWSDNMHLPNADIPSSTNTSLEKNRQFYSNFKAPSYPDNQLYQPATIHGYELATYLKGMNASQSPHSRIPLDTRQPPRSSESSVSNYADSIMHARNQDVIGSLGTTSLQSPTINRFGTKMVERSYYDPSSVDEIDRVGSSAYSKKYHSSPDISALITASRTSMSNEANLGAAAGNRSYLTRLASKRSPYMNFATMYAAHPPFNESSQPNFQRDAPLLQSSMNTNNKSLWAQQPFEQLFGGSSARSNKVEASNGQRSSGVTKDDFSYTECEERLLQSLRFCIMKLLKLEGSGWLFMQNGSWDEVLIDQVAAAERISQETIENQLSADLQSLTSNETLRPLQKNDDRDANCIHRLPKCGDDCVWRAPLVLSFGVWCILRILNLSLLESRPELWGKYTYVLNRLQGIIDPAFSKPRRALPVCACLQKVDPVTKPISGAFTIAAVVLEVIKEVEQAISGRKGRSGTAAGAVAFPKGKENLASVLKRYKRRLSSKPSTGQ